MNISANNKRIAKNTIALYFRTFITMLLGLYTGRVMLDALGVDDYGINAVVAMLCIPFVCLGYVFKYHLIKVHKPTKYVVAFCISLSLYAYYCFCNMPQHDGVTNVSLNQILCGWPLFMAISISTSIGIIGLSALIEKNKWLKTFFAFYGRNSLIVLVTHMLILPVQYIFLKTINCLSYSLSLSLITIMILEIPIIYTINKWMPFLIGKN